jgi:catechol 2,3-dioxygenase-like lactoylglutathione lyase family enzyme
MQSILGLDHVIVLVRDLERAETALERLGFRLTPRGTHSVEMGTANATAVFRDGTYLELMTVLSETPLNRPLAAMLREREGLSGIAMKTQDARAAAAELETAGLGDGAADALSRPVELEGGPRDAAFTLARIDPAKTPGAWMFVCQHHTPEVVWREGYLDHGNGIEGLAEVIGIAADLPALARAYAPIFGEARVHLESDRVRLDAGGAGITFLAPLTFASRFGQAPRESRPHLAALSFRSASPGQVARLLRTKGLDPVPSPAGERILLPPTPDFGVSIEVV